jgi:hypothetical protein
MQRWKDRMITHPDQCSKNPRTIVKRLIQLKQSRYQTSNIKNQAELTRNTGDLVGAMDIIFRLPDS